MNGTKRTWKCMRLGEKNTRVRTKYGVTEC